MNSMVSRNQSIDALKGAAILSVVFLHLPSTAQNHDWNAWQVMSVLARFAVPCFFLISGYFFFSAYQRNEVKSVSLYKSALRVIKIFLFWALFYAVTPPLIGGGSASQHLSGLIRFPHSFILAGSAYHLWFLSSLLQGFVLTWIALQSQKIFLGLSLGLILFIIAWLAETHALTQPNKIGGFDMKNGPFLSTFFVMLGACIASQVCRTNLRIALLMIVMGCALCLAEVYLLHAYTQNPICSRSLMIGIIPLGFGLMILAENDLLPIAGLKVLGRYSLGVYLIHPWVLEVTKAMGMQLQSFNPILLTMFFTFVSLLLTWLLAKSSIMKQFVV